MGVDGQFSSNDRALIAEACRRVEGSRNRVISDRSAILMAISTALLQGRRDLFGLVKAGSQAG
jgi:hypothetical protein